jgi:hypothetical protein
VKTLVWAGISTTEPAGSRRTKRVMDTWRHKKRGTVYTEVGTAVLQSAAPIGDSERLMIYRGEDGQLWARPFSEFMDGRFERIDVPAPSGRSD